MMQEDRLTGALINIETAREELEHGKLQDADEHLACAQRALLMAGAKDIGPLEDRREDLYENVDQLLVDRDRKISRLKGQVENMQKNIESLAKAAGERADL